MTKVISIADDAYNYLKSIKDESESFSKVIRRLVPRSNKNDILKLAGELKNNEYADIMDDIVKSRNKVKFRTPKFD